MKEYEKKWKKLKKKRLKKKKTEKNCKRERERGGGRERGLSKEIQVKLRKTWKKVVQRETGEWLI